MSDSGTRRFGRYTVVATLGRGAMGEVLRARDERLGRDVAVKTIRNVFGVASELFRQRFEAEARALAALSHPSIVQVHDLGVEGDEPYLVMELVDGPSLKERLAQGTMPAGEVRKLGIHLARALEAAHARGILHRDVKPANLLLGATGWKLADFGVAHVPDSSATMTGQFLGTPAYAAPEALVLGQFSGKSDVFAVAVVMIEALTGEKVRGDATLSEIVQQSANVIAVPGSAPPELAAILQGALALDPARRPTAGQLADRLEALGTAPIATPAVSATFVTSGARRALPLSWILAGAGALVVLIGIVAATSGGGGGAGDAASTKPSPVTTAPASVAPVAPVADDNSAIDPHYADELRHVSDKIAHGDCDKAWKDLGHLEDKYGETAEIDALRSQCADQGDQDEGPPGPPHGPPGHHKHGD